MFITFEGLDGSGKTTVLNIIVKKLKLKKINFILTREPGNLTLEISKKIRQIIVSNKSDMIPMAETLLFSADRILHLQKLIIPALNEGKIVLCDRYFDSTFAYQGAGRRLGIDRIIKLQENITNNFYPDLTFYFDVDVDESIKRVELRGPKNRIDNENKEFIKRVYEGYKKIIKQNPKRFVIIDANKPINEVVNNVFMELEKRIFKNNARL